MLKKSIIEKQLTYSGFSLDWINSKEQDYNNEWETIESIMPDVAIVYSLAIGKNFGNEASLIVSNVGIFTFVINGNKELVKEFIDFKKVDSVKVETSIKNSYIFRINYDSSKWFTIELENSLLVTHLRQCILQETNVGENSSLTKKNYKNLFSARFQKHVDEINVIENDIQLEPSISNEKHKTFEKNFAKLKTIYHVRRIITGVMIAWVVLFGLTSYLTYFRIKLYFKTSRDEFDSLSFSSAPAILTLITIILIAGVVGVVIYFFVYQKHLKNSLINVLCYLILLMSLIIIIANIVPVVSLSLEAYNVIAKNTEKTRDSFKILILIVIYCESISHVFLMLNFIPIIMLTVGIYKNKK